MSYTLQVEGVERAAWAAYQAALTAYALGAKVKIPDPDDAFEAFDRALIADAPEALVTAESETAQHEFLEVMGLRSAQ